MTVHKEACLNLMLPNQNFRATHVSLISDNSFQFEREAIELWSDMTLSRVCEWVIEPSLTFVLVYVYFIVN